MKIRYLGIEYYSKTFEKMKKFTSLRNKNSEDELWLLEHYPIYTQGQNGNPKNILNVNKNIPIFQSDRGGQITYHGPGQLIGYILIDLKRKKMGIKKLIDSIHISLINLLTYYSIPASTKNKKPGVFVKNKKIASIGLRIKNNCTYHGFSLNVSMNLNPFKNINPCGFKKLEMTQISNYVTDISMNTVINIFVNNFTNQIKIYENNSSIKSYNHTKNMDL
ncbi:octanoyltransferase [Candidatus Legionella polyplacis]|uniref:Octanoyltransferase n=1 Tax=Candidatus Legionella polyplacis TaxID=2005262 RepID=A0ABZ2H0Y1_9GAMM|nr:lipoyl(octanoyl) transferase LipB [Candidatus Legionella polyplacis]ATW02097.1 octanoyltransferase [Candidatus Legionella polyplacis]